MYIGVNDFVHYQLTKKCLQFSLISFNLHSKDQELFTANLFLFKKNQVNLFLDPPKILDYLVVIITERFQKTFIVLIVLLCVGVVVVVVSCIPGDAFNLAVPNLRLLDPVFNVDISKILSSRLLL